MHNGAFNSCYKMESIELFEVGDDIAELSVMRRNPVAGDLYQLAFNNIARGALYFRSDSEAIAWAKQVLNDECKLHALFNYGE